MQAAAAPPWPGAAASAAAGPQWPGAPAQIRSLAGGFSSVGPARPKLFAKLLPVAPIQAPVPTSNSFEPLSEVAVLNKCILEESPYLKAENIFSSSSSARTSRPSKKRKGKRAVRSSSAAAVAQTVAQKMFETPEKMQNILPVPRLPRPLAVLRLLCRLIP